MHRHNCGMLPQLRKLTGIRKLMYSFSGVDPATLTRLFCTFCLSLHGAATWSLSNPALRSLEVAFNNILRKIWRLPFNCHTRYTSSYCEIAQYIQFDLSEVTVFFNFSYYQMSINPCT